MHSSKKLKISKDKSTTKITFCGVKFDNPEKWNILRGHDESILFTKPNVLDESIISDTAVYESR